MTTTISNTSAPSPSKLHTFLESRRTNFAILFLIIADIIITLTELSLDLAYTVRKNAIDPNGTSDMDHSSYNRAVLSLITVSFVITCIFALEIILRVIGARGPQAYYRVNGKISTMHIVDTVAVVGSFVHTLLMMMVAMEQNRKKGGNEMLTDVAQGALISGMLVVARLWRVVRVLGGAVHAVRMGQALQQPQKVSEKA
ncbi:hypothetical protein HK102_005729 [Quaeritorhiza haematococci]|nr:hypothetical protein HK102_005729 [Quaeritorhiza haematococci]